MKKSFFIIEPSSPKIPIIISVPHSGVDFPDEIKDDYMNYMIQAPDDTDWFVHNLYNFVSDLGITIIHARYSRWVIDLNRDPESKPLYDDGRIITALTPSTDFLGNDIYIADKKIPDRNETNRRLKAYYWPYYQEVEVLLNERVQEFGNVLLWDAHSIRRTVPTIQKDPFPDMILGDNDSLSANSNLIETAFENLNSGIYEVNHNDPFKGGHITRYFGRPENNIHALQLEMNKILYMDDSETQFDEDRANKIRNILKPTFESLARAVSSL